VDAPKLSETESALLCDGLQKIVDTKNLHDIEVANIRRLQILSQWRNDIEKAVSEGESMQVTRTHLYLWQNQNLRL